MSTDEIARPWTPRSPVNPLKAARGRMFIQIQADKHGHFLSTSHTQTQLGNKNQAEFFIRSFLPRRHLARAFR